MVFLSLTITTTIAGTQRQPHNLTKLKTPFLSPTLQLKDIDGNTIDISKLNGKIIVLNFWASWCKACLKEMASLQRLHLKTANRDIAVIAVNIGEDIDTITSFFNSIDDKPTFPVVIGNNTDIATKWQVKGLPTTYIINANGLITYKAIGSREFDHPELMRKIVTLHMRSGKN